MRRVVEISKTGFTSLRLHPLRSCVTLFALIAMLVPYLAGLGLAHGIERDTRSSLDAGGDLYVSGTQFGRNVAVPLSVVPRVRDIDGVTHVAPRIIGRLALGREHVEAVLVGIPATEFPESVTCIAGQLPQNNSVNEFVVGTELARRLNLKVGAMLPPFYQNESGEHVSKIVGLFQSDLSHWQSMLMFTTIETAATIFDQKGLATDLVVRCRSGYEPMISTAVRRITLTASEPADRLHLQVIARQELELLLTAAESHREGIFNLHFTVIFVIGILVVLVTSGLGLPERRREIGILKATGWQTDEILLRCLVESGVLAVAGAALSILIAFAWLRLLNGFWIAGVFLHGVARAPSFRVPFQLAPVPALLAVVIALTVTMCGSLWSSWRAAVAPPDEAMR